MLCRRKSPHPYTISPLRLYHCWSSLLFVPLHQQQPRHLLLSHLSSLNRVVQVVVHPPSRLCPPRRTPSTLLPNLPTQPIHILPSMFCLAPTHSLLSHRPRQHCQSLLRPSLTLLPVLIMACRPMRSHVYFVHVIF